jgi:hypothetical protein
VIVRARRRDARVVRLSPRSSAAPRWPCRCDRRLDRKAGNARGDARCDALGDVGSIDDTWGRSESLDPDNVGDIADEGAGHRG